MRDNRDIAGGSLLVATGLFAGIYAVRTYDLGSISRMGPGMMPAVLAGLLVTLGAWIAIPAAFRHGEFVRVDLRPVCAITVAIVLFGLMLERFGLAPAVATMVVAAAMGERPFRWRRSVVLALGLAILAVLIFPVALGLPIRIVSWSSQ